MFLEGTGAMVLDHIARIAYTAQSNRANPVALERFCTHFNFEPMAFATADARGQACYHTNVMLCVGTDFALGGFHLIADTQRRGAVRERLREGGRDLQRRIGRAYQDVADAWGLGIAKVPAVVVDRRYVVYGEPDVARAMARIEAHRRTQP